MDAVGNGTPKVDLLNMIMFMVPLQTPAQLRTKATLYNRDDNILFPTRRHFILQRNHSDSVDFMEPNI